MAYEIDHVDDSGSEGLAHWQMLLKIKTFAEAHGWTTLRYTTPTDGSPRELILHGVGLSADKDIYIGFRTYHSVSGDYYNLSCAGFIGYVDANAFTDQPGYYERGVCAHNLRIDYWLCVNGQRIVFGIKVGTPVYEVGYAGLFFPYATPGQYPYPLMVAGTLNGVPGTRYSDTNDNHSSGVKGNNTNAAFRSPVGAWTAFRTLTHSDPNFNSGAIHRDCGGYYLAKKIVVIVPGDSLVAGNVWGEFDGLRYITGFNNVVENTTTIDGNSNVVIQDVFRTGIGDYFLLEML